MAVNGLCMLEELVRHKDHGGLLVAMLMDVMMNK
jgi:hypothetical protein